MKYDVTLRFSNEEDAKQFVETWLQGNAYGADVINVQAVPVAYCKCGAVRGKSYTQGRVYGWWVCPLCNCVTKMVFERWGYTDQGYNLIPQELLDTDIFDEDDRSPKEWSFLLDAKS